MVTEEDLGCFLQELKQQKSIYDLLVLLYIQIEGAKKPQYIQEYYETQNDLPANGWGGLPLATNEMLSETITFETYKKLLSDCIRKENLHNVAIRLLFEFDEYFKKRSDYPALCLEPQSFVGDIFMLGPLNTVKQEYCFYLMPDCHYFKNFNKEGGNGIRFLNQSEFTAVDERVTSYKIIKAGRLDKKVKVKYYTGIPNIEKSHPELKVGIIPVAKQLWCKPNYYEYPEKNYFELENDEKYNDKVNGRYIQILQKCIEEEIQIVVFPELAMNKKTLGAIREFLVKTTCYGKTSLELICLGSLWEDGVNEGFMMSGAGTILVRNQKINPFFLKKDGKVYWEKLKQEAQEVELIDLPKIGRIQYLICKDGLNDSWQHDMWNIFEIAFSVVSSYSESLSHFESIGGSFSVQYAGVQILANACAPRFKPEPAKGSQTLQNEIGFIMVPCCKNEKKDASYQKEPYAPTHHCQECCFGGCIQVFKLNPSLIRENVQILKYGEEGCVDK